MVDSDGIAAELHAIAERIARSGQGDWVDAWRSGDAVTTDQAAMISGVSADTMRRRREDAAAEGQDLGVLHCGVWSFSKRRVLNWIEKHQGLHARLVAEDRARKSADLRLKPQKLPENVG